MAYNDPNWLKLTQNDPTRRRVCACVRACISTLTYAQVMSTLLWSILIDSDPFWSILIHSQPKWSHICLKRQIKPRIQGNLFYKQSVVETEIFTCKSEICTYKSQICETFVVCGCVWWGSMGCVWVCLWYIFAQQEGNTHTRIHTRTHMSLPSRRPYENMYRACVRVRACARNFVQQNRLYFDSNTLFIEAVSISRSNIWFRGALPLWCHSRSHMIIICAVALKYSDVWKCMKMYENVWKW